MTTVTITKCMNGYILKHIDEYIDDTYVATVIETPFSSYLRNQVSLVEVLTKIFIEDNLPKGEENVTTTI